MHSLGWDMALTESGWARQALPDLIDFKEGPGIMARDFREFGVPLIRLAGLSEASVLAGCNYLDRRMVERKWSHFRVGRGDTVISTSATLGRIARVGPEAEGAIPYTGIIRMRPKDGRLLPDFIEYLLKAPDFQRQIEAMGAGSVMRHFGPSHLRYMTLATPPPEEQKRIATVLSALDDKIESNRRVATALDEIVQAEFQARFVDFVGSDHSEDGPPGGWRSGVLADLGTVHRDLVRGESDLPYIGLDLMPRASRILTEWLTEEGPIGQTTRFGKGDVLFGKLRPYFKKAAIAPIAGRCSTEILVLRPTHREFYGPLLGHVSSQPFIDFCVTVSRGTRMPRAEWKDASTFQVAIPPTDPAAEHTDAAKTSYARIHGLTHESRTLAAIRDALLPKLVSGQIRVPDTADPGEVVGPVADELVA